jgi:hypothetical protein
MKEKKRAKSKVERGCSLIMLRNMVFVARVLLKKVVDQGY